MQSGFLDYLLTQMNLSWDTYLFVKKTGLLRFQNQKLPNPSWKSPIQSALFIYVIILPRKQVNNCCWIVTASWRAEHKKNTLILST